MKYCVIVLSNRVYFKIAFKTIKQIRKIGKYKGDLVYVYGNDVNQADLKSLSKFNIIPKYFPEIQFDNETFLKLTSLNNESFRNRLFQYHKFYLFNIYFKEWDRIFYMDSGIRIQKPLDPFFKLDCTGKLLANSDAQPTYVWKLYDQFDQTTFPQIFKKLINNFKVNIDYFQSTVLLFDTSIIETTTFKKLLDLTSEYPISKTNDQAILNLYFNGIYQYWEQIPLKYTDKGEKGEKYLYDYLVRNNRKQKDYIMLKKYYK